MTDRPTIGGSEIAVTVGMQRRKRNGEPYQSAFDLWARLRGLLPRYDLEAGPAADAGNDMEPGIGLRYARERGLVLGSGMVPGPHIPEPGISAPDLEWLRVRCDFYVPALSRILEVKAPQEIGEEWGPDGSDQIANYYTPQVVAQLAVVARLQGWERCDVAVAARAARYGDRHRAIYTVARDEAVEEWLLTKAHDWYRRHVEDGVAPLTDGSESTARALSRVFRPEDVARQATPEDLERFAKLVQVRTAIAELEHRQRELEHELQAGMATATTLVDGRQRLATWRPRKGSTRIDLARLKRERPDIVSTYAETGDPGRTWRIE